MTIDLGRPARRLWALRGDGVFLNHGSYGACPLAVLDEQQRLRREMEDQPDLFFSRRIEAIAERSAVRRVAGELAMFVGAAEDDVALVENATTGIQTVLESIDLRAGDEVLITDHQYNAVRLAVEMRCRAAGAVPRVVRIPVPTTPGDVAARILDAAGPRVKLAIVDHITSPTALVFPVETLVPELRARGIEVLVDGAHALGQTPLDLHALGADWFVANAHKWLYAPKGSALLYASADAAPLTRPLVTSHFVEKGFPRAFDYIGTRDYTAWLSLPAALAFFRELGVDRVREHNSRLVKAADDLLLGVGARPVGPLEMSAAMRTFMLPQRRAAEPDDAAALRRGLWDDERIQVRTDALFGRLLLRVSAQAYVGEEDVARLAATLERAGWPGR
jgi:isopenicillin-N epimerase